VRTEVNFPFPQARSSLSRHEIIGEHHDAERTQEKPGVSERIRAGNHVYPALSLSRSR
jgi:hypothetical protein